MEYDGEGLPRMTAITSYRVRLCLVAVVAAALIVLVTCLLFKGLIGDWVFATCLLGILGLSLVSVEIDKIQSFRVGQKEIAVDMRDIKQAKEEVHAKAETMKSLAGDIAEVAEILGTDGLQLFYQGGSADRFYGRERKRLKLRNKTLSLMKAAERSQTEIDSVMKDFDDLVRQKLMQTCFPHINAAVSRFLMDCERNDRKPVEELSKLKDPESKEKCRRLTETLHQKNAERQKLAEYASAKNLTDLAISTDCDRNQIESYLKAKDLWNEDIAKSIAAFCDFVKTNNLSFKDMAS